MQVGFDLDKHWSVPMGSLLKCNNKNMHAHVIGLYFFTGRVLVSMVGLGKLCGRFWGECWDMFGSCLQ